MRTTGFQYRDRRGRFYPQELAQARCLEFYAADFRTCESDDPLPRLAEARGIEVTRFPTQVVRVARAA